MFALLSYGGVVVVKVRSVVTPEQIAAKFIRQVFATLWGEVYLFWRVVRYDVPASVFPGLLFALASWHSNPAYQLEELPVVILKSVSYFSLYIYAFCLANQLVGVEEDRLNKPDRPLVTGECSMQGARYRLVVAMALFDLTALGLSVIEWAILWQLVIVFNNLLGWSRHWFIKNFSMGLGTAAIVGPAWQMVAPITPTVWNWIIFASVAVFGLIHLQDHRDVIGDGAVGRRTIPVVFGEIPSRVSLGAGFSIAPVVMHLLLIVPLGSGWQIFTCETILGVLSLVIAWRVLFLRNQKADHKTYMLFPYWFCGFVASAIILL